MMVRGLKGCQAEAANRLAAASQHLISIPNAHKPTGLVKGTKHPQAGLMASHEEEEGLQGFSWLLPLPASIAQLSQRGAAFQAKHSW
jgi:hypothetical protein